MYENYKDALWQKLRHKQNIIDFYDANGEHTRIPLGARNPYLLPDPELLDNQEGK